MFCLVQGMVTSRPAVAHKPKEDLRQVQEKSIPTTIGCPKAITFMERRGRQYNKVLIKRYGDQAWNSRKGWFKPREPFHSSSFKKVIWNIRHHLTPVYPHINHHHQGQWNEWIRAWKILYLILVQKPIWRRRMPKHFNAYKAEAKRDKINASWGIIWEIFSDSKYLCSCKDYLMGRGWKVDSVCGYDPQVHKIFTIPSSTTATTVFRRENAALWTRRLRKKKNQLSPRWEQLSFRGYCWLLFHQYL